MLMDALGFPFESDGWIKTLLIGTVLTVASIFIIPIILVNGYLLRVLRAGANNEQKPPVFDEWGEMFVDGLRLIGVVIVYFALPGLIGLVLSVVLGFAAAAGGGEAAGVVGLLGLAFSFLVTLLALYVFPAGVTNMARTGRFGAAFDIGVLRSAVTSVDYLVAVVFALGVGIVLSMIAGALTVVLVGFVISFYAQIVTYYMFGRGVGEVIDSSRSTATP